MAGGRAPLLCLLLATSVFIAHAQNATTPTAAAALFSGDLAMTAQEVRDLALAADRPVIVAIGDSITQFGNKEGGWVLKMAAAYAGTVDVLNKGVVMGSTRKGKWLAEAVAKRLYPNGGAADKIKLVTICFGANDGSVNPHNATWRMVPLDEFGANLHVMLDTLNAAGIANILLITPPPATRVGSKLEVTAEYAEAVRTVGRARRVPVADLFTAMQAVGADWPARTLLPDKLHLSVGGNAVMYDTVMAAIEAHLPAVAPKAMREAFGLVGV